MKSRQRAAKRQAKGADRPLSVPSANVPGIPCPDCGTRISVTMEQILSGNKIVCQCGLALSVDTERSKETLRDLRELRRQLARGGG
jgi:hypothetical protein